MSNALFEFTIRLADSELILGHRLSEWCGHGPELEEDIALINIALDHLGQCRSLYQYAGEVEGKGRSEDDLAYHRVEREFRNLLLCEQPNGHYGHTIARSLYYDTFMKLFYTELLKSSDERLAAIAEKSLKEVKYHFRHSAEWTIRLGDGTDTSKSKIQEALNELWMYSGELFEMDDMDQEAVEHGFGVDREALRDAWLSEIQTVLDRATLSLPEGTFFQSGSKQGVHSEHLGYLLAEMQYLPRQFPEAAW